MKKVRAAIPQTSRMRLPGGGEQRVHEGWASEPIPKEREAVFEKNGLDHK
jgi:hypothetical protein